MKTDIPLIDRPSRALLRAWLEEHHTRDEGVWLVRYKKHTGERYVPHGQIAAELLCWGWIDSQVCSMDADRSRIFISPRRPGSIWSAVNKAHVERELAAGRMAPPGLAKIEAAKVDGSWTLLDDVEALIVPDDLAAALDGCPPARANYEAFPDSAKKAILWWIKSAKRPTTRASRVATAAEKAARGERAAG
ncbi:MAG: YdeI/OmpD-associated family protein [Alphaproteobacteria bacterium]|nr:YdeI/OmpD-associated family protein [Alphaproteobacteria bacterium]